MLVVPSGLGVQASFCDLAGSRKNPIVLLIMGCLSCSSSPLCFVFLLLVSLPQPDSPHWLSCQLWLMLIAPEMPYQQLRFHASQSWASSALRQCMTDSGDADGSRHVALLEPLTVMLSPLFMSLQLPPPPPSRWSFGRCVETALGSTLLAN